MTQIVNEASHQIQIMTAGLLIKKTKEIYNDETRIYHNLEVMNWLLNDSFCTF